MTYFSAKSSAGYTLIEILMAVTLSLILMLAVVQIFAMVGDFVTNSQAVMEMDQNIRNAQMTLQLDLARATAKMTPPLDPAAAMGYFIYFEGEEDCPVDSSLNNVIDVESSGESNLAGDADTLQFTIHDVNAPIISYSAGDSTQQSNDAEVRWYIKNNKLYRNTRLLSGKENSSLTYATEKVTAIPEDNRLPVLQNVIKFDVQVWDTEKKEYIDGTDDTRLKKKGYDTDDTRLKKKGYDTGTRFTSSSSINTSTSPERVVGYAEPAERYSTMPLKGIRIKVRVVEPTTGMIRDFTVEQDFTGN